MQIQKKDGSLQNFDASKVSRGIISAGVNEEEAGTITAQVEAWAQNAAVDDKVSWSTIKDKVLELLRASNPEAATRFEEYK